MSDSCPHKVGDWALCIPCALGHGKLTIEKLCAGCGTRMVLEDRPGESPTKYDVYQLELHHGGCNACPDERSAHASRVPEVRRPVRWRIADSIPLVAHALRRYVVAIGREIGAGLHRQLHKIEAALGDRVCLFCGCLTANQSKGEKLI